MARAKTVALRYVGNVGLLLVMNARSATISPGWLRGGLKQTDKKEKSSHGSPEPSFSGFRVKPLVMEFLFMPKINDKVVCINHPKDRCDPVQHEYKAGEAQMADKNHGAISAPLNRLVIPRILSLGAGVQSSTLAMMMKNGDIPRADLVIFADTGAEPSVVYKWLEWLVGHMNMPYMQVKAGEGLTVSIERACRGEKKRTSSPPLFTRNGGKLFRQCTWDFKVSPIRKAVKEQYKKCVMIRGISFEERKRAKPSDVKWITYEHPLVDMGMTRLDCERWMVKHGYPIPPRSACVYCPYRCNAEWQKMRDLTPPKDWEEACRMDDLMRDNMPGVKQSVFVHKSCIPLREAPIESKQAEKAKT